MSLDPTPCSSAFAALKALLEEGREPDPASTAHWKDCPGCREAVRAALRTLEAVEPTPAPTPELEAEVRRQARRRTALRAAGAAFLVAAALAAWCWAFPEFRGPRGLAGFGIVLALATLPAVLIVALRRLPRRNRLYKRLRKGRVLSGVCLGLGERTGTPVWAWRLGFLVLCLTWEAALPAYALLALAMPVHPEDRHLLLRFRLARFLHRIRRGSAPAPHA